MYMLQKSFFTNWHVIFFWVVMLLPPVSFAEDNEKYSAIVDKIYPGPYTITYYYTEESTRINQPAKAVIQGKEFVVDPGIRPPFVTSVYLLEHSEVKEDQDVLDIGTGTGFHAIFAAEKAKHIVATDIDSKAIENAKKNAVINGVSDKIDFRVGDLLAPLKEDEKFDVIYINIAYHYYNKLPKPWELHERFFANIRKHMKPYAKIYYQTGYVENIPYIQDMVTRNGLYIMRINMDRFSFYGYEPITIMVQE